MPKLTNISSKKLIKILETLGFQLDHSTGSYFIFYNKEKERRAVVPYHKKELPKGTLTSILREAGVTREDLKNLTSWTSHKS